MDDQASRWEAFHELEQMGRRVGEPGGVSGVVLEDQTTRLRYVRVQWFGDWVRQRSGPGEVDAVLRRMTELGWTKPNSEGRIKATRPGFRDQRGWAFFVVPPGWENR
jgi:hypothetical protein